MKQKRKYTRKVSKSVKEGLPPDILASIERTVSNGKALGLFDDKEERIERALRYQEFIRGNRKQASE